MQQWLLLTEVATKDPIISISDANKTLLLGMECIFAYLLIVNYIVCGIFDTSLTSKLAHHISVHPYNVLLS